MEIADLKTADDFVRNPGRCLLCVGSCLTGDFLRRIELPVDVWGSGWKGADACEQLEKDLSFYAVRGPHTANGFNLSDALPLGDPALLMPTIFPKPVARHCRSVVIRHLYRIDSTKAELTARGTGCDILGTCLAFTSVKTPSLLSLSLKGVLADFWNCSTYLRTGVQSVTKLVGAIAGSSFVLTGSLHGAIIAQAYDVPWAAYSDGYIDAPAKWMDWGAYLGVSISFCRSLVEGLEWWQSVGRYGRLRELRPLVESFPYFEDAPNGSTLASVVDSIIEGA